MRECPTTHRVTHGAPRNPWRTALGVAAAGRDPAPLASGLRAAFAGMDADEIWCSGFGVVCYSDICVFRVIKFDFVQQFRVSEEFNSHFARFFLDKPIGRI